MRRGTRIGLFVVAVGAGLIVAAVWLLGLATYGQPAAFPERFSSSRWIAADKAVMDGSDTSRCRMLLDLRWRIGLVGKSRAQVAALLGNADTRHVLCTTLADYMVLELVWHDGKVAAVRVFQS